MSQTTSIAYAAGVVEYAAKNNIMYVLLRVGSPILVRRRYDGPLEEIAVTDAMVFEEDKPVPEELVRREVLFSDLEDLVRLIVADAVQPILKERRAKSKEEEYIEPYYYPFSLGSDARVHTVFRFAKGEVEIEMMLIPHES